MPITSSATKKMRRDTRKRALNLEKKVVLKKAIKTARENPTTENVKIAQKAIDKSVKNNTLPKNRAARIKSALSKKVKR